MLGRGFDHRQRAAAPRRRAADACRYRPVRSRSSRFPEAGAGRRARGRGHRWRRRGLAQVLGHRVGIALEARDAHFAEAERGTAGELDLEPRLALVRIDGGAAVRDARRGVAPARELGRGLALRRIPFGLTERFATPQTPVVAHALEERLRFRVLRRRSGEAKLSASRVRSPASTVRLMRHGVCASSMRTSTCGEK